MGRLSPCLALAAIGCCLFGAPGEELVGEPPPELAQDRIAPGAPDGTKVVLLGTGTPVPTPDRSGPAVAVVSGGRAYLVDFGPGVVRRAAAAYLGGVPELSPERLSIAFVTHLHSDHTAGYPDLILTPAVIGRDGPLDVYGPPGIEGMTRHVLEAWGKDVDARGEGRDAGEMAGYEVRAHEVEPGRIYEDERVVVTAVRVDHGDVEHAYAYRFDAADRSVVVSGDTAPTDAVVEACAGCDVLVHEVYCKAGLDRGSPDWQAYHRRHHTSSAELAEIARRARPGLLVLYHVLAFDCEDRRILEEVRRLYEGEVVLGEDLAVL